MKQHQQYAPRLRRGLAALLLCLAGTAQAADQADSKQADSDLYLKALQSIAEGRRSDASEELSQLIVQQPEHAGAWLDLALTQCSLGRADEAERLFAAFETRFEPARPILELIAEAREQGCNSWEPFSSTLITLGRGIDQNVNQGARTARYVVDAPGGQVEYELSEDFRPRHDQYIQLSGEYLREVTPNGTLGFVQYQLRRNDNLHQYDSGSLFTGLEKPWRFGSWRVRGTGTLGLVSLGGKLYQRQAQLQARVTPPLDLPDGVLLDLVGGVTYNTFPTLTNFDSSTQEARAHLSWREPGRLLSATLGYLNDHALAQRPGGDREGSFVNLLARRTVWYGVSAELGYTRQTWNSSKAYAPGLIEQVRAQTTQVLRGTLIYPINKSQSIQLEGRIVRNRENISIFQYNNRQLQFSWQWQLP